MTKRDRSSPTSNRHKRLTTSRQRHLASIGKDREWDPALRDTMPDNDRTRVPAAAMADKAAAADEAAAAAVAGVDITEAGAAITGDVDGGDQVGEFYG